MLFMQIEEYKGKCDENNFVSKLLYKRMLLNTCPVQFMEGGTYSMEFRVWYVPCVVITLCGQFYNRNKCLYIIE